ncbi:MAG: hypothetical protein ACXADO_02115 [Candidatus Thorarchaeota archaeon]
MERHVSSIVTGNLVCFLAEARWILLAVYGALSAMNICEFAFVTSVL